MLKIIIGFFIFCLILFIYLHTQFHLKNSNDLEIYEIEQASKDRIEEICDLRQPVLLDILHEDYGNKIINSTNKTFLAENYPVFDIKIRNANDSSDSDIDVGLPLPLQVACKLFKEDEKACYFSENNGDFLQETGIIKHMSYNDSFLRPYLVSNCYYDIILGSNNLETPFRYDLNYRNYYMVTQGSVTVKLSPPKSSKYLYPTNDYETFEFRSPINPWDPQTKYKADFDKIKCLEIVLKPGKILYIPAYWWYTFKFQEDSSVSCFKYRTYMNNLAISPHIFMYALQNQNVERKIVKKMDITKLNNDNGGPNSDKLTNNDNDNNYNNTNTANNNNDDIAKTINNANNISDSDEQIPSILIPKSEPEPMPPNDLIGNAIVSQ